MSDKKRGLGRGFGALVDPSHGRRPLEPLPNTIFHVALDRVRPNPFQPRQRFDEASLQALAASIQRDGMLQPLAVRQAPDGAGEYELIAGERRLRAAKLAGLREAPCVLIETDDEGLGILALVENLMREDLNVLDEAEAYQQLSDVFGLTQEVISARVGRSRSHVANTVRLLTLPETIRACIAAGELTAGHGRALLAVDDDADKITLAQEVLARKLSVRETETLVNRAARALKRLRAEADPQTAAPHPHADLIERFTVHFGTKVRLTGGRAKGAIELHYFSEEELMKLVEMLLR
jgi:ParB family chromosome partitioning protein